MGQRLPATVERDAIIVQQLLTRQSSAEELAERFGISRSRVYQIVSLRAGGDVPDNVSSDVHLLRLEQLFFEMQRLALGAPTYKIAATGTVVVFDDKPVADNSEKINAAIAALRIDESIRKLTARDKPRRKEIPHDEAMQRVREYLESLPQAEVVRPGDA